MVIRQLELPIDLLCGLGILGVTLLSILGLNGWSHYLELLSHFQVQYFAVALFLWSILLTLKARKWSIVSMFCLAFLLVNLLPWFSLPTRKSWAGESVYRVIVANLEGFKNKQYDRALSLINKTQPDSVVFVEFDRYWLKAISELKATYPYFFYELNPPPRGLIVLSRYPLDNARVKYFDTRDTPSLVFQTTLDSQSVSLIATHPKTPLTAANFRSRNHQLTKLARYVASSPNPFIVLGDLNITMWSPYYRRMEQISKLHNARRGYGILPTWSILGFEGKLAKFLAATFSIPIDHCLISNEFEVVAVRRGESIGSDHLPLIVDLRLPKPRGS